MYVFSCNFVWKWMILHLHWIQGVRFQELITNLMRLHYTHTHILVRGFNRGYDYMLRATGHIPLFLSENHVLHTFDKLTNLIENSSDLRCRFTLVSKKWGFVYNRGTYIATGHVRYYFWFSPFNTCRHSTRKTGICVISPYPTPRDLRGHCLYCFNYSGKPGITPVLCVCPVAWSKTYGCPQLKVLTNAHRHAHTHTPKNIKKNRFNSRLKKSAGIITFLIFGVCFRLWNFNICL